MRKTESEASLLQILQIAHAVSTRGEGISIREALRRSSYSHIRAGLSALDLQSLLANDPDLLEAWISYAQDKRTSGGWYLLRTGEIGRVTPREVLPLRPSITEAVADYVLLELDYWASGPN
jgi:hypothetical protein